MPRVCHRAASVGRGMCVGRSCETGFVSGKSGPRPPRRGGSFEKETFSSLGRIGGRRRLRQLSPVCIGAPCPKVSLGPSRPSFISEASPALLKVRIRPLPPSRAGAASSTHRFRTLASRWVGVCVSDDRVPEFQVIMRLCVSGKVTSILGIRCGPRARWPASALQPLASRSFSV